MDGLTFLKSSQCACCAKALKLEALPHPSSAYLLPLKAAARSESQAPSGSGPWRRDRSGPNQVYSGTTSPPRDCPGAWGLKAQLNGAALLWEGDIWPRGGFFSAHQ